MTISARNSIGARDRLGSGEAADSLERAVDYLLGLQDDAGWWRGKLETNVTMDAEDLMMRQFLGIRGEEETAGAARWIRRQQRDDGSWANFYGGPADVSTTTEAYIALRLAGDDPDAPHMRAARDIVLARGGLEASRVFTKIWLALFGLWPWEDVPVLPPEIMFLPRWMPLNIYDFGCWARQTIVPLAILSALRPQRELGITVDELRLGRRPDRPRPKGWARFFGGLDAALHRYERLPRKPLRRTAIRRAAAWIEQRQEADGSWGGIQPPWVYSLMAFSALGYSIDHPVMAAGLRGWDGFTVTEQTPEGPVRWIEACQSPVWDTALAVVALGDAGVEPTHPAMRRAAQWLLDEEVRQRGDWAVRRRGTPAGGWAFEFNNDNYPDIDDTGEVLLALRHTEPSTRQSSARSRAHNWLLGMQSRGGGWAAFDADNTREVAYKLPFCDFGAVIDPPSVDVTAHVVEALAADGLARSPEVLAGVQWILDEQEPDGSWFGRWGANYVYGTGAAVPALVAAGVPTHERSIRDAVRWLEAHQHGDGGWGEDLRSYDDPGWSGRGDSTASQTAWALLALHAAGESEGDAVRRGVDWLVAHQRPDGGWDEPQFTGTGFPGDFYINYHLYRVVFPITALARIVRNST